MPIHVHDHFAIHPGPWLREELVEPHGLSVTALAGLLKVSRQALSTVLNGHARVSADMALRFEQAFGVDAATLLRMQAAHDLALARRAPGRVQIARIAA